MYKILCLLLFVIIVIIILYNFKINQSNYYLTTRHLTNEFNYAHFCEITRYNYFLFPSLLFTHPQRFILKENDGLWIPKGWWHWVESYDSVGINFWLDIDDNNDSKFKSPFMNKHNLSNQILEEIDNFSDKVTVWNSYTGGLFKNKTIDYLKEIDIGNIISLPGYLNGEEKMNSKLMEKINQHIKIPNFLKKIATSKIDHNFWISSKFNDTGLHYDDNNGFLCVLKGKKKVTLYPPSDSIYLKPFCVLPKWAKNYPIRTEYNTNKFIKKLNQNKDFPSSRLLYETLACYNNNKGMLNVSNAIDNYKENNLIWGFKLQDNIVRWELYAYHYDKEDNDKQSNVVDFILNEDHLKLLKNKNDNTIIHSFDLYLDGKIGDEIHFYDRITKKLECPFEGVGVKLINNKLVNESKFILDESPFFIEKYNEYMDTIGFDSNNDSIKKFKQILNKYKCTHYCIHNKYSNQIFIQYLGISIDDFIDFLYEFNYPTNLQIHIKDNLNKYRNIIHEITIVYDIETTKPIRSAIYGIV